MKGSATRYVHGDPSPHTPVATDIAPVASGSLCPNRRALGDISNSQQSHNRLNRPHGGKASLKNLKKTFAPVFAIATVPATPKPRKRADDLLEVRLG